MKKKIAMLVLALAFILSPLVSYASGGSIINKTLINANNEVGISYNLLNQYYTESIGDNENGNVSGIGLSVTSLSNVFSIPLVYEHLSYTNNWGNFNYNDINNSSTDSSDIVNINARIGKVFSINQKTILIPYVAYNYRKWDRNTQDSYSYLGYQEVYNYSALGVGVLGEYSVNNALVIKGRLQYSRMIGNDMNAYDYPANYPTMNFNLQNEPIYTVGVGLDYDIDNTPLHAIVGIKYAKTNFGQSSINSVGLYTSNSMTSDFDYTVGLAYSF